MRTTPLKNRVICRTEKMMKIGKKNHYERQVDGMRKFIYFIQIMFYFGVLRTSLVRLFFFCFFSFQSVRFIRENKTIVELFYQTQVTLVLLFDVFLLFVLFCIIFLLIPFRNFCMSVTRTISFKERFKSFLFLFFSGTFVYLQL